MSNILNNITSETQAPAVAERVWSPYQTAIFDAIVNGSGDGVIEAVAGSGKTSTLVETLRRWRAINQDKRAIFVAFNKSIAQELQRKVPNGVDASTLHSACFRAVVKAFKGIRVDDRKAFDYAGQVVAGLDQHVRFQAKQDLAKAYGLAKSTMSDLNDVEALAEMVSAYGLTIKYGMLVYPLMAKLNALMIADTTRCTFDEMLSFVIDHKLKLATRYDLVCVDESQDMNVLQIALLKQLVKKGGKLWAVGDSKQACYLFRGANADAMTMIRRDFSVPEQNELPLSITYRCPRLVVAEAQQHVKHIQAADNAIDGAVVHSNANGWRKTLMMLEAGESMVICRRNAPLVGCALFLVSQGRKATVRGRDIGKGLVKVIDDLDGKYDGSIMGLGVALDQHLNHETLRLISREKFQQAQQLEDKVETIHTLMAGCMSIEALMARIESIFADQQGDGIVLSSVHKSKGLEAQTVVWIDPDFGYFLKGKAEMRKDMNSAAQEVNLMYIAITRAQHTLIYQPLPQEGEGDEG